MLLLGRLCIAMKMRSHSTALDLEPSGSELKAELHRPKGAHRSLAATSYNFTAEV